MNEKFEFPGSEEVSIQDLPSDLGLIARVIGVDAALKLAKAYPGCKFYIGGIATIQRQNRDRNIRKDFDGGMKVKPLAIKYQLSERQVENILGATA